MAVVSVLTPILYLLPLGIDKTTSLYDLLLLPVNGIVFAWPGCVMFLAFGLPTIFALHRLHQTGFGIFALFGMLYTALGAAILYLSGGSRRPRELIVYLFIFGLIGLINGMITRLIVYGWRDERSRR
jgi:hypothetical protein